MLSLVWTSLVGAVNPNPCLVLRLMLCVVFSLILSLYSSLFLILVLSHFPLLPLLSGSPPLPLATLWWLLLFLLLRFPSFLFLPWCLLPLRLRPLLLLLSLFLLLLLRVFFQRFPSSGISAYFPPPLAAPSVPLFPSAPLSAPYMLSSLPPPSSFLTSSSSFFSSLSVPPSSSSSSASAPQDFALAQVCVLVCLPSIKRLVVALYCQGGLIFFPIFLHIFLIFPLMLLVILLWALPCFWLLSALWLRLLLLLPFLALFCLPLFLLLWWCAPIFLRCVFLQWLRLFLRFCSILLFASLRCRLIILFPPLFFQLWSVLLLLLLLLFPLQLLLRSFLWFLFLSLCLWTSLPLLRFLCRMGSWVLVSLRGGGGGREFGCSCNS